MNKDKICRICWNDQFWCRSSGRRGKSKNKKAFENIVGYGHEEWLLDKEKIIDGYHYSFLEPIHKYRDKYINHRFSR